MKCLITLTVCAALISGTAVAQSGTVQTLKATEFSAKHDKFNQAPILDVRTAEEFSKGNIGGSVNADVNAADFEQKVSRLDKNKPVFVYCLAGVRSADAAKKLKSMGFTEVYNLEGGLSKWRAEGLPERSGNVDASKVITEEQWKAYMSSGKRVLIDVYAEWCGPCIKMKPAIDAIAAEMKNDVEVVRVSFDDNRELVEKLNIDELPTLLFYANGNLYSRKKGFMTGEQIKGHLVP
ncbi:MAG: thioredoxin domain-containing protein [Bacteroidota bacterium]